MKWQESGKDFKETSNEVELRINRARPVVVNKFLNRLFIMKIEIDTYLSW